jgi:AcrR family transcriptional regulator
MIKKRETPQRKRIIELAQEKFHRFGIRRVSMEEIARELRMSKKSLYRHFATKEELVASCVKQVTSTIIPRINEAYESKGSPGGKLQMIWQIFSLLPRFVSAEFAADLIADYPQIWEIVDKERQKTILYFEKLIEEGVASGEIRQQINPKVMGQVLLAVINNVMTPRVFARGEFTTKQVVQTLIALFSSGLLQRPGPSRKKPGRTR